MLPRQLQNDRFGFVKLKPKSKIPFERNWQKKPYTWREIQVWMDEGNNYGVICGIGSLVVIDSDDNELSEVLFNRFPVTYTIKTSSGFHFYFLASDINKKIVLSKNGKHCGEIISGGCQVVGPGCTHPSGSIYKVDREYQISTIH